MSGQVVNLLKVLALPLILFLSEFWHQLFQLQGVYLRLSFNLSSAYHPMMGKWALWIVSLRCIWDVSLVVGRKNGWNGFLGKSIVTIQASTAPSKSLLNLYKEDQLLQFYLYVPGTAAQPLVDQKLRTGDQSLKDLKIHIAEPQARMKIQADKQGIWGELQSEWLGLFEVAAF